jgi:hypothetical protein
MKALQYRGLGESARTDAADVLDARGDLTAVAGPVDAGWVVRRAGHHARRQVRGRTVVLDHLVLASLLPAAQRGLRRRRRVRALPVVRFRLFQKCGVQRRPLQNCAGFSIRGGVECAIALFKLSVSALEVRRPLVCSNLVRVTTGRIDCVARWSRNEPLDNGQGHTQRRYPQQHDGKGRHD